MRIAFLLYDEMDLMDFAGPHEALLTANRLLARFGAGPVFDVVTASVDGAPVRTYGGVTVTPAGSVADVLADDIEVLVVPGAVDVEGRLADPELLHAVSRLAGAATTVSSVCTGAFLLAAVGLLNGQEWTTHWEDIPALAALLTTVPEARPESPLGSSAGSATTDRSLTADQPPTTGRSLTADRSLSSPARRAGGTPHQPKGHRARIVESGRMLTAGGITSGIDLGLHLVARYTDPALARLVARQMDYAWDWYGADDGGTDPVILERTVSSDPATLFRMWSTADGVQQFMPVDTMIDSRIGGRYEYHFLPDEPEGLRGGEGCRILALEPDRMLTFTWNSPPGMVTRGIHTWVVVTFTPTVDGRTTVRLAHWGHGQGPDWDENRAYFQAAWDRVLTRLENSLSAGR